jgi:PhnB protein
MGVKANEPPVKRAGWEQSARRIVSGPGEAAYFLPLAVQPVDLIQRQRVCGVAHTIAQRRCGILRCARNRLPHPDARMVVSDREGAVRFLRSVFDVEGEIHEDRPGEICIGDPLVFGRSAGERESLPPFLYEHVVDADASYARALAAGAVILEQPLNIPYGGRRAIVRDPAAMSSRSPTGGRPSSRRSVPQPDPYLRQVDHSGYVGPATLGGV